MGITVKLRYLSDPSAPGFQAALKKTGAILMQLGHTETQSGSTSSHRPQAIVEDREVSFARAIADNELAAVVCQLPEQEAAKRGLPYRWGFAHDGAVVVRGYAEQQLHQRSGVDVESTWFQDALAAIGQALIAEKLTDALEIEISWILPPHREY